MVVWGKNAAWMLALSLALAPLLATADQNKSKVRHAPAAKKKANPHQAAYQARALKVSAAGAGLGLKSNVALVVDQVTGETVYSKNVDEVHPVASITKLMTSLVILDAQVALTKRVEITSEDIDTERGSRSRLKVGTELSRNDMLHLALMASENRAAHALGRTFPGGLPAFVEAMNAKARELGMMSTRFVDPTGLSSANVSTAADLAKLVRETHRHSLIRQYSTNASHQVSIAGREVKFNNTNRLVASDKWEIGLSKTGFINEAGRCLVMQAKIQGRPMVIVLLDSWGKLSRIGDANRIKKWLTSSTSALTSAG
jgi:D-alanyl-D-alanine endopeptidase (penicillin-binding protein 7)